MTAVLSKNIVLKIKQIKPVRMSVMDYLCIFKNDKIESKQYSVIIIKYLIISYLY
jgi:hypothetical protein